MSRYLVGGRVLKTVLAVTLAIFITQYFDLPRILIAAIVALITVQKSFYHSLHQSLAKLGGVLLGGLLGMIFSYFSVLLLSGMGWSPWLPFTSACNYAGRSILS